MSTETSLSNAITTQMTSLNNQIVTTIERISKIAEKGPVNLLLSLGASLIILAIVLKIEIAGFKISNLSVGEFITIIIAGTIILLAGASIRLYQYKTSISMVVKEQQKLGAEILNKVTDAATGMISQTPDKVVL